MKASRVERKKRITPENPKGKKPKVEVGIIPADILTHPDSVQVLYRPVLQEPIPEPPDEGEVGTERADWWALHTHRIKYGWTQPVTKVWMTPAEYLYFNFVQVEIKVKGRKTRRTSPLWSDNDHRIFAWIYSLEAQDYCMAQDGIVTKGRRKHFSYVTHAGVFLHDFCFDLDSHVGIGYDSKGTREEGQRIFEGAYNSLHPYFKHDRLLTDKEGELSNGQAVYGADGKVTGYVERNTIIFKELDKNPGALRGRNLKRVLFDEFGKYRHGQACINATEDNMREGLEKHGSMIVGGTSDAISNKSTDYKNLWNSRVLKGWSGLFIGAGWMAPPYVDYFTGISDRASAEAKYREEREILLNAGDTIGYYSKMQENPLEPKECFTPPVRSRYPERDIEGQVQWLRNWDESNWLVKGTLDFVYDAYGQPIRVDFTEDANGFWWIYKDGFPRRDLDNLNVMGVDDVYQDDAPSSDSKCAIAIYCRPSDKNFENDLFVAYYEDRPQRHLFNEEVHKAMWFFNARCLIERNDIFLSSFLLKKNMNDQLIWVNEKVGIRNDDTTIPQQEMLAHDWFQKGKAKSCYFERILEGFKNWRSGNDDVASAIHLCFHALDILEDVPIRTVTKGGIGINYANGVGAGGQSDYMNRIQSGQVYEETSNRVANIQRMRVGQSRQLR